MTARLRHHDTLACNHKVILRPEGSIPRLDLHDGHAGLRLTRPATPMTARLESNQPRTKWALRGEVRSPLPRPAIRLRQRCLSRKSAPHGMDHHAFWACGARRLQKATAGVCGRGNFCRIFGIFPITPKLRTHNEKVLSKTPTLGDFDKIFYVSKSGGVCSTVVRVYRLSVLPEQFSP